LLLAKPFLPVSRSCPPSGRQWEQETVLRAGDLEMHLITRKVTRAGQEIDLLPREFSPA